MSLIIVLVWPLSIDLPYIGKSRYYKVECDGSLWADHAACKFAIGVDTPVADPNTWREYGDDYIDDLKTGIHTERVYYLGPGAHSFHFLGRIYDGGPFPYAVCCYMTITVTVYTHGILEKPASESEDNIYLAEASKP